MVSYEISEEVNKFKNNRNKIKIKLDEIIEFIHCGKVTEDLAKATFTENPFELVASHDSGLKRCQSLHGLIVVLETSLCPHCFDRFLVSPSVVFILSVSLFVCLFSLMFRLSSVTFPALFTLA